MLLITTLLLMSCSNPFSADMQSDNFVEFKGTVTRKGVPLEYVHIEVAIKESVFRRGDGRGNGSCRLVWRGKTNDKGVYSIKIGLRSEPLYNDWNSVAREKTNPKCWLGVKVYADAGWKGGSRSLNLEWEEMSMREFKERLGIPFEEGAEDRKAWMPIVPKMLCVDFEW